MIFVIVPAAALTYIAEKLGLVLRLDPLLVEEQVLVRGRDEPEYLETAEQVVPDRGAAKVQVEVHVAVGHGHDHKLLYLIG